MRDDIQAFPLQHTAQTGMTLRDYFASASFNAIISNLEYPLDTEKRRQVDGEWHAEDYAKQAYYYADAMIKERNKK